MGLLERLGLTKPKGESSAAPAAESPAEQTAVRQPPALPVSPSASTTETAVTRPVPAQPQARPGGTPPKTIGAAAAGAAAAAGVAAAVRPATPPMARTSTEAPTAPIGLPAARPSSSASPATLTNGDPVPAGARPEVLAAGPGAAAATRPKAGSARRTRKARLRLSRLDPWSVMKTSFLFSIAAGIMLVVAVYVVWTVLASSGLFDSLNEIVAAVVSTPGDTTPFRIEEYVNGQKVLGIAALIACIDVVIFTSLATLGSFLYNLAATMLGGLEITLAED